MKILITGVAGFIGSAVTRRLLGQGHSIVGIDNLNTYQSVALKRKRLASLHSYGNFEFHQLDLSEPDALFGLPGAEGIERVLHLAAQAGVRYSMENPFPYVSSNVVGHLAVLEFCRRMPGRPLLIYASSSSVYGRGAESPFAETRAKGEPASLYAVTKETDELMSQAYASLYGLRQIGLRFFTVYGPWGRPDMAYWIFTRKGLAGEPVQLFNEGKMRRDFTYIDDALDAVTAVVLGDDKLLADEPPHILYNIGSGVSDGLDALVGAVSQAIGRDIEVELLPLQAGDIEETCADISRIREAYDYAPKTDLATGVARFVDWFRADPEWMNY